MIAGVDIDAKGAVAYGLRERELVERPLPVDDPDALQRLADELHVAGVRVAYVEEQLLVAGVPHGVRGIATQGARHARVRDALGRAGIHVVDVDGATWQRAIGVSHRGRSGMTRDQRRADTKRQVKSIVGAVSGRAKWSNYDAVGIAIYAIGMRRLIRERGA